VHGELDWIAMNALEKGRNRRYETAGQPKLALPLAAETLKLRKAKLGADHIDTLKTMGLLARAYQNVGELDQALPLYEQASQVRGISSTSMQVQSSST
jgi:hypothetical protein